MSARMIDAHHHLWDPRLRPYPWMAGLDTIDRPFLPDDLRTALEGTPVTGTIVVQASATDEETDWLVAVAESTPEIVGVVGWAALDSPAIGDRLDELRSRSGLVRGIRHLVQDEPDPHWLARPEVLSGMRAVGNAGLAYDLLIKRPQSAAALEAVRGLPEVRFVVDHAAKPHIAAGEWDHWHADLAALAAHDNVSCKISGLVTEAAHDRWREQDIPRYIDAVLELFGPHRCMFGSDWPVSLLAAEYTDVLDLTASSLTGLSPNEQDALFRATATTVYGLD